MSDTPRTDKELERCAHCWKKQAVSDHFSRELETELNAANERIHFLEGVNERQADEVIDLKNAIREHRTSIEDAFANENEAPEDTKLWKIIQ